jgi:hypothetical protein
MSSPPQANELVNGVGVSGGGGCNKLIGEHSFSVRGPAKSHLRPLAKDDQQAFGSGNPASTDIFCRPRFPPTLSLR